jgi:hypothetical protein
LSYGKGFADPIERRKKAGNAPDSNRIGLAASPYPRLTENSGDRSLTESETLFRYLKRVSAWLLRQMSLY